VDLRSEGVDLRSGRVDLRSEGVDLRPERMSPDRQPLTHMLLTLVFKQER
jgi:hypothetical protein